MRLHLLLVLGIALAPLATPAAGQVYKWVDANGVVNYGDRPPATAGKAKPLDEANARLSVVPGMPREEIERERERGLRRQLEQAQLEIESLKARPATTTVQLAPSPDDYPHYWGGYGGGYAVGYPGYPGYPMNRRGVHKDRWPPYATHLPVRNGPVKRAPPQR
jgi:hypothetical protein